MVGAYYLFGAFALGVLVLFVVLLVLGSRAAEDDPKVRLYCPESEKEVLIATEATEPLYMEDDVAAYGCGNCGKIHEFLWGPPAPVYLNDREVEP